MSVSGDYHPVPPRHSQPICPRSAFLLATSCFLIPLSVRTSMLEIGVHFADLFKIHTISVTGWYPSSLYCFLSSFVLLCYCWSIHPLPLVISLRYVLSSFPYNYGSVITTPSRSFYYSIYTGIVLFIFIMLHIYLY